MTASLIDLKAQAAIRHEDFRIATKHARQAEDRTAESDTPQNQAALTGARNWRAECQRRYLVALREWNAAAERGV